MEQVLVRAQELYPIKGVFPHGYPPYPLATCLAYLGIDPIPLTFEELKPGLKRFYKKYHPDKHPDEQAPYNEIFSRGRESYNTIEAAYEAGVLPRGGQQPAAAQPAAATPSAHSGFSEPNRFWATYKPKPPSKKKQAEAQQRRAAQRERQETYRRRESLGLHKKAKKSSLSRRGAFKFQNTRKVHFGPMPSSWYRDRDTKKFFARKKYYNTSERATFRDRSASAGP